MTALPIPEEFEVDTISSFARARSEFLDRFNQLEAAILRLEHRLSAAFPVRGTPLSQRLATLSSLKPSSTCSAQLQRLVRECETLLPFRATIVHSTMKVRKRNKGRVAIFQNSFDEANDVPLFAVTTERDFERVAARVQRLTDEINGLIPALKPSGPLQPRPAEAADP
ncbi:MAG TPA: hypothetical protein VE891_12705 [Allosphingosinicella sp.]|nr:hypothetical protein [Allosphingosinicella sp.]